MAIGQPHQRREVLVDDHERQAGVLQARQAGPDLLADQRREPLGGLVQDQQARVGHERPPDGEHLLLAARQVGAQVALALLQARKHLVDAPERPRLAHALAIAAGGDQVLAHGQIGKDVPAFWHQPDARARHEVRGPAGDVVPAQAHRAAARRHHAHDRLDGGGLAHAVAPDERDDLALADIEAHPEQGLARPVERLDVLDLQEGVHLRAPDRPGRRRARPGSAGPPRRCRTRCRGRRPPP